MLQPLNHCVFWNRKLPILKNRSISTTQICSHFVLLFFHPERLLLRTYTLLAQLCVAQNAVLGLRSMDLGLA
jgi:hypothetical protein